MAKNAFVKLNIRSNGTFLTLYPAEDGGKSLLLDEVEAYLDKVIKVGYDKVPVREELKKPLLSVREIQITKEPISPVNETVIVSVAADRLSVKGRFYPPTEGGHLLEREDIVTDMVRAGVLFFGILPSTEMKNIDFDLKHTFSLKTVVSNLKTVYAGESISYSRLFVADRTMKVATLPIGYADGFRRSNGSKEMKIYVKGKPCDILGRVCMDQTMIDVSDIDDISIGDEITVFGKDSPVSVYDYSEIHKTIPHEVMCNIAMRVPRVYFRHGKLDSVLDNLV